MPYVARKDGDTVSLHSAQRAWRGKWPNVEAYGPLHVDPTPSAHIGHSVSQVGATVVDIVQVTYGEAVAREVARVLQRNTNPNDT